MPPMPNTTHVIGRAWIAPRRRDRTVFRSIYLHGSFQPLSSNSKCNALPTMLGDVLDNPVRAGLVEQTVQWQWSSLHHPTLADLPRFCSTLIGCTGSTARCLTTNSRRSTTV